jgi:colicin import membrane protein
MGRKGSFEERARAEVERIKGEEAEKEQRLEQRMRELAEEAREYREAEATEERKREAERDAKLRRSQEEKAKSEEEHTKRAMFNTWVANGGSPAEFEAAWPNLRREMLTQRTLERETQARQLQRTSGVSRT